MVKVLANGVFDLLHYGHLLHLEQARSLGDYLIVSVTKDAFVGKGPGRPVYPELQRASLISRLKCVDEVILVSGLIEALEKSKPDVVVKGCDYTELESDHAEYCLSHGIRVAFTDTPKLSSTDLINEARSR